MTFDDLCKYIGKDPSTIVKNTPKISFDEASKILDRDEVKKYRDDNDTGYCFFDGEKNAWGVKILSTISDYQEFTIDGVDVYVYRCVDMNDEGYDENYDE
jgi:hypothetical protein